MKIMQPIPHALVQRTAFLLDNLHGFLEFGESRIEQALDDERKEVEVLDQALIETYGDDLWTDADVEILQERWDCDDPDRPYQPYSPYHYVFPRYLRYSFVTLVALMFESEVLVFCRAIADNLQTKPPESGGKSSTIKNARAFLASQLGSRSVEDRNWEQLQNMLKIRNCIVHAGGRVDFSTERDHLVVLAKRDIGLGIDVTERPGVRLLSIDRKYCTGIVDDVSSFFGLLFRAAGL